MDSILLVFNAVWQNDFSVLTDPRLIWTLYFVFFLILFLENGVLPMAFLPGDSLLILAGVLASKDDVEFTLGLTILVLVLGASIGTWVGYIQGRWLGNTKTVQNWLSHLPAKYHQRSYQLFDRHGLAALFAGRFIAFVRTLLPILIGVSGLPAKRFQLFNWLSAVLWVTLLTGLGYLLGMSSFFKKHEQMIMSFLVALPLVLLVIGLITTVIVIWRRKKIKPESKS